MTGRKRRNLKLQCLQNVYVTCTCFVTLKKNGTSLKNRFYRKAGENMNLLKSKNFRISFVVEEMLRKDKGCVLTK